MKTTHIVLILTLGVFCYGVGFLHASRKEKERCAVLLLNDTISETAVFRTWLQSQPDSELKSKIQRYHEAHLVHLDSVLNQKDGIDQFIESWKESGYPTDSIKKEVGYLRERLSSIKK